MENAKRIVDEGHPIRVGFVSSCDPRDIDVLSGSLYCAYSALQRDPQLDVILLSGETHSDPPSAFGQYELLRRIYRSIRGVTGRRGTSIERHRGYGEIIGYASDLSSRTQKRLQYADVDVLVVMLSSTALYGLETDLPIIYAGDATARDLNTTYPEFRGRSAEYHRACDEIDRTAISKCRIFAAASHATAKSAEIDYGVPRSHLRVIHFGANVTPGGIVIDPDPPARDRLELLLVAADPERKRLEFCIEIAESLKERGWNVTLHYVGPFRRAVQQSPVTHWSSQLKLSNARDRKKHCELLRRSHWLLLPSVAETYGIAPCEAAHFGRPSVVSDVGGLPTVVEHEQTGVILPVDAPAAAYADAIERCNDPERYRAMSAAALDRARTVLSWDVWARRMKETMIEVLSEKNQCLNK